MPMQVAYDESAEGGERIAYVTGLRPDEPIFVLRAQDAAALPAIALWHQMAAGLGGDKVALVERDVEVFLAWRRGNTIKDAD